MGETYVSVDTTCAVSWALVAICIVLTAIRYTLRGLVIRVWYWDDLCHGIVLIGFVAQVAVYQAVTHFTSDDPLPLKQMYLALTILGYSCTLFTKVAFLMFYRLIFRGNSKFMRAWWAVLIVVFLTYWTIIACALTGCNGGAAHLFDDEACEEPSALQRHNANYAYSYAIGVATDLAVMILPLTCVHTLQLPTRRKVGVGALFCAGLLIIIFDTLRFAEGYVSTLLDDGSIFGFVEVAACLIAMTIPTLPALLIWKRNGFKQSSSLYAGHLQARGTRAPKSDRSDGSTRHGSHPNIRNADAAKPDDSYELAITAQNTV